MAEVIVYWRPRCGFCMRLDRSLTEAGVTFERRNIWEDDEAAAFVRSVNRATRRCPPS